MPASKFKATLFLVLSVFCILVVAFFVNQYSKPPEQNTPTSESTIPKNAVKMTPETDAFPPPIMHSN